MASSSSDRIARKKFPQRVVSEAVRLFRVSKMGLLEERAALEPTLEITQAFRAILVAAEHHGQAMRWVLVRRAEDNGSIRDVIVRIKRTYLGWRQWRLTRCNRVRDWGHRERGNAKASRSRRDDECNLARPNRNSHHDRQSRRRANHFIMAGVRATSNGTN